MSDEQTQAADPVELSDEERIAVEQADEAAKSQQFGQTGDRMDPGLGSMGGAGASGGMEPDILRQSAPQVGNSSDLAKP